MTLIISLILEELTSYIEELEHAIKPNQYAVTLSCGYFQVVNNIACQIFCLYKLMHVAATVNA